MPVTLALVAAGNAVLIGALAVPLARGRVPRNMWYGFRTPRTLESDAVWYPANRAAGRHLVVASALTLLGAPIVAVSGAAAMPVFLLVVLGPLGVALAASFAALKRIP